jgi:hypothetical protein
MALGILGVGRFWCYFRHAIKYFLSNAIAPTQHLFLKHFKIRLLRLAFYEVHAYQHANPVLNLCVTAAAAA